MSDFIYIGKSQPSIYGEQTTTGYARYTGDFNFPNMLCGKLLHSPVSHARILKIDASRARNFPGVKDVITAEDTPCKRGGHRVLDRTLLAWKKVRYAGEPVAAVAAVDEDTALEALELIRVEYEEIPAVFDPLIAMKPDSPLIHEEKDSYLAAPMTQPLKKGPGNILELSALKIGNVDQGLKQSDLVYTENYRTQVVHQGFMETHTAIAQVDSAGRATLWCSTKSPFSLKSQVAAFLNYPMEKIRVIAPAVGGDFGGKGVGYVEPLSLLLSRRTGLPVKMVLSREEEFTCTFMRDASVVELTIGVRKDGTFQAIKGKVVFDSGAYSNHVVAQNPGGLLGGYHFPNIDIEYNVVYTNNTPRGFVRAPWMTHPLFALESHINMIDRKLGIDPVEIRLKNAVEEGYQLPDGPFKLGPVGFKQTLQAAARYLEEHGEEKQPYRGWGVACGKWGVFQPAPICSAIVKINEDGSATVITGVGEQGAGQHTLVAQIAAEVLSIPIEAVRIIAADTETTPLEETVAASWTTYRVGTSVKLAAEDARNKLLKLASMRLEAPPEALELKNARVYIKSRPERGLPLAALAASALASPGGQIIGTGEQLREAFFASKAPYKGEIDTATYSTHVAQVEVDPETGQVKVLKYFAAHDVGHAINPQSVRNQIEGGVVFGMGYALTEEVILNQGRTQNDNLTDYKMPTFTIVPDIETELIEVPSRFGAYGAKGIGEPPVIPVAPAIANAVYDAAAVRITRLPVTAEKVFLALKNK